MKNTKFNFSRAWLSLTALLMSALVAVSFTSCKSDDDDEVIHYSIYPVELSADDPVSGVYFGSAGYYIFRPSIVYATSSSCSALDSVDGLREDTDYVKVTFDDYSNYPNVAKKDLYLNLKDSSKVYVVYNLLSDADSSDGISDSELDKHSGVILFQAKYSPWESPTVGCWYGVKFQFLTKDGEIPTSVNKDSVFSDTKIYIEAAYEETGAYNNISSLDDAVEKFGFNNTDCFSTSNWTASSSGADKTGRAVSSSIVPTKNIFSKVE